jgi:uncharacterized protein (DUF58 family)
MKTFLLFVIFLLACTCAQAQGDNRLSDKNTIFFVLDCSSVMGHPLQPDGESSRFDHAKKLIEAIAADASSKYSFGLRIFGVENDCHSTELRVPVSKRRSDLKDALAKLSISRFQTRNAFLAVKTAVESDLLSHHDQNVIVLLACADDSCFFKPDEYAKLLHKHPNDQLWIISVASPNSKIAGRMDDRFLEHQDQLAKSLGCRQYSIAEQSKFLREFLSIVGKTN